MITREDMKELFLLTLEDCPDKRLARELQGVYNVLHSNMFDDDSSTDNSTDARCHDD